MIKYILRILTWVIGIAIGYLVYRKLVQPMLFDQCLLSTNTCLQLEYYNYENSAVIHVLPAGYWIYFNGKDAFIYNAVRNEECDKGYEPVYKMDATTGEPHKLICVESLNNILKFYTDKNIEPRRIYKRYPFANMGTKSSATPKNFQLKPVLKMNAYDILNLFQEKNILNFQDIR